MNINRRCLTTEQLILSGICVLAIVVRIWCFVGIIGSDDMNYNRNAYALATGTFSPAQNHQMSRLGLVLPVALLFKLFGVSEVTSIASSFGYFILTFVLVVYVARILLGKWGGILAGMLYTFLPLEIFHATMLLADLPSSACMALSGVIIYLIDVRSEPTGSSVPWTIQKSSGKVYGVMFLAGVALGWAYLIRETFVFFCVFVAGYMAWKALRHKTLRWTWFWFWIGVLVVVGLEMGYYFCRHFFTYLWSYSRF